MEKKRVAKRSSSRKGKTVRGEPLSVEDQALIEVGKKMLSDSIEKERDFCKFMITVSTGSIPTYLLLLGFIIPRTVALPMNWLTLVLTMIPPFIFLISAMAFIMAYLPKIEVMSQQVLEEIKGAYTNMILGRHRLVVRGLIVFFAGTISAILSILALIVPL